jgi:hypothetical protein
MRHAHPTIRHRVWYRALAWLPLGLWERVPEEQKRRWVDEFTRRQRRIV